MHRFVAIQVESEGDNEDLVTTKQMFRNIWSRIVSIEALTQQIKELTASLTFPREVFKLLREMPEFSQINFQPEAKISKFIKSNDGQWRCEVARPGSSVTVSATIDIDLSYPEIPPIFKLEVINTMPKKTSGDEEMKDETQEGDRSKELKKLLMSIEDEINVHHSEYCDHAIHADFILSFQLRKLMSCVELLYRHQKTREQVDFADPEVAK
jgi:hypothetical protein